MISCCSNAVPTLGRSQTNAVRAVHQYHTTTAHAVQQSCGSAMPVLYTTQCLLEGLRGRKPPAERRRDARSHLALVAHWNTRTTLLELSHPALLLYWSGPARARPANNMCAMRRRPGTMICNTMASGGGSPQLLPSPRCAANQRSGVAIAPLPQQDVDHWLEDLAHPVHGEITSTASRPPLLPHGVADVASRQPERAVRRHPILACLGVQFPILVPCAGCGVPIRVLGFRRCHPMPRHRRRVRPGGRFCHPGRVERCWKRARPGLNLGIHKF